MDIKWKKFSEGADRYLLRHEAMLDVKWKRFTRNEIVRIICNLLLIICIVLGAVFVNQITVSEKEYSKVLENSFYPYELFGDTDFQEEIGERLKQVLTYMVAEVDDQIDAEELRRELDDTLNGMYDYRIVYTDREGTKKELSNSDSVDISEDTIQVKYEGSIQGDTYQRNWENVYYGTAYYLEDQAYYHRVDFEWLNVGELIQEISREDSLLAISIAKEIVQHLELYRDSLQKFLCYLATEENVPEYVTVEKSTYYKIYGCYPDLTAVNAPSYISDMEYDEASGLYIDEYGDYYNPKTNNWISYDESDKYEKYCEKMEKKIKSIQDILDKENVEKTEDNVYQLTKEEKENLVQNIAISLQASYNIEMQDQYGEDEEEESHPLALTYSISAILQSPTSYSISFGVKTDYVNTKLAKYYASWEQNKTTLAQKDKEVARYTTCLLIDAICSVLLVLFLCYVCGRKVGTEEVQFLFFDHWKTEVMLFIGGFLIFGGLLGVYNSHVWYYDDHGRYMQVFHLALAEIGICLWLLLQVFYSIIRRIKAKTLYKDSILALLMGRIQGVANQGTLNRKITLSMIALLILWVFIECAAMGAVEEMDMRKALFLQMIMGGIWLLVFAYVNRVSRKLSIIMEGVRKIRGGELTHQIPTDGKQNHLNMLAQDINSLSEGLGYAVDDMLRSERLKTELISNVSHDIKTPLTSVITYVDLLKREDIQPEKAKEYVEVLEQKSQRLKMLTDDLFEAAKASSGAMTTEITKIDIGALVCQAAGEFSERLEKNQLELRNNIPDSTWFVMADGRLAWRIVENLFSNVTKYAQPASRVYIDVEKKEPMIEIVIKNVSAYELNISAKELMERFTRGDRSRNTEGSGLGLNIAKSLAELQGGNFFVDIDGDLFKAVLQLPIYQ